MRQRALAVVLSLFAALPACKREEAPEEAAPPADSGDAGRSDATLATDAGAPQPEAGPPSVPELGEGLGRLMAGWEGLEPGMRGAEVLAKRPRARVSDVSPVVVTETLAAPWLAVTYRFHRTGGTLREVLWTADDATVGPAVFDALVRQGMRRWRARPETTLRKGGRVARWQTPDGELRLRMSTSSGRIRLQWVPPRPAGMAPAEPRPDPATTGDATPAPRP